MDSPFEVWPWRSLLFGLCEWLTPYQSSSKLSLSTPSASSITNPSNQNDHPTRNYTVSKRYGGDTSSHGKPNPFNAISSPTNAVPSPTVGASSAFGLGSGAFASFGSAKT